MTHPGEIVWMGGGDGVWEVNKVKVRTRQVIWLTD